MRFLSSRGRYALAACLLILAAASCKKKEEPARFGGTQTYMPLALGRWIEYDVDSVVYDDFNADTINSTWQMRHEIVDTFRDANNNLSYAVNVTQRKSPDEPWAASQVFYLMPRTDGGIDMVMQNLRFLKLVLPINESTTWMGNSQISSLDQDFDYFQGWTYQYANVDQAYDNGRATFNKTVSVVERDDTQGEPVAPYSYAERTFSKAVYAENVGMVYRELLHWEWQGNLAAALKGYGVVMRATDHN